MSLGVGELSDHERAGVPSGEAHADPRYQIRAVGDDLDPFGLIDEGGDSMELACNRGFAADGFWCKPGAFFYVRGGSCLAVPHVT
jgi:hypothetical protein